MKPSLSLNLANLNFVGAYGREEFGTGMTLTANFQFMGTQAVLRDKMKDHDSERF